MKGARPTPRGEKFPSQRRFLPTRSSGVVRAADLSGSLTRASAAAHGNRRPPGRSAAPRTRRGPRTRQAAPRAASHGAAARRRRGDSIDSARRRRTRPRARRAKHRHVLKTMPGTVSISRADIKSREREWFGGVGPVLGVLAQSRPRRASLERGTLANRPDSGTPGHSPRMTSPSTGATSPACPARGAPADLRKGGMGADDPLSTIKRTRTGPGRSTSGASTARAPALAVGASRPSPVPRTRPLGRSSPTAVTPTAARAATASRPRPTAPAARRRRRAATTAPRRTTGLVGASSYGVSDYGAKPRHGLRLLATRQLRCQ